jgi:hypothetical protein
MGQNRIILKAKFCGNLSLAMHSVLLATSCLKTTEGNCAELKELACNSTNQS